MLIAHEEASRSPRANVLVGVDGSAGSEDVVRLVAELIDPQRAAITVVSVMPPVVPDFVDHLGAAYIPEPALTEIQEEEAARHQAIVDAASGTLAASGFSVVGKVAYGKPSQQLLTEGADRLVDMLAVGSRGLGPIRRALLGSVSDHVARLPPAALIARRPG